MGVSYVELPASRVPHTNVAFPKAITYSCPMVVTYANYSMVPVTFDGYQWYWRTTQTPPTTYVSPNMLERCPQTLPNNVKPSTPMKGHIGATLRQTAAPYPAPTFQPLPPPLNAHWRRPSLVNLGGPNRIHVSRPRNATNPEASNIFTPFALYRNENFDGLRAELEKRVQGPFTAMDLCQFIARVWQHEPREVHEHYTRLALARNQKAQ